MKKFYVISLKIQWGGLSFHSIFAILFTSALLIAGFINSAHSQQVKYPALQTSTPMNASQLLDIGGKLQVARETRLLDDVYLEKFKDLTLPSDRYVTIGPDGKMKGGPPVETTPPGGGNGGGGMVTPGNGGGGQAGLFWKIEGNDQITSAHFFGTINNAALIFKTNNNEWVRISESGNVGIGIASPSYKLHVSGNVNASQYFLNGVLVDVNLINSNISGLQSAVASQQLAIDTLQNEMLNVQSSISNVQVEITAHDSLIANLTDTVSGLKSQISNLTSSQWQNTGTNSISYTGNVAVNGNFQSTSITTTNINITDKISTKTAEFDTLRVAERMEVEKYIQSDTLHALSSLEVNNSLRLVRDTAMMYAEIATKDTAVALMFQKEAQATVEIGEAAPPAPGEARAKLTVVGNTKLDGSVNVNGNLTSAGTISANNVSIANDFTTNKIIANRITSTDTALFIGDSSIVFQYARNQIYGSQQTTGGITYRGLGIGGLASAEGLQSTAVGMSVRSTALKSVVIGSGTSGVHPTGYFNNNISNSLMVGFNTSGNIPTLYVGPADGTPNSTGKIGFGTSNPQEVLHILKETLSGPNGGIDASIRLQSKRIGTSLSDPDDNVIWNFTSNSNGYLAILNGGQSIQNGDKAKLFIKTDGKIGSGTNTPLAKFDVRVPVAQGNDPIAMFKTDANDGLFFVPKLIDAGYNYHSVAGDAGIFWDGYSPTTGLVIGPWQSNSWSGMRITHDGKIGIGTNNPSSLLTLIGKGLTETTSSLKISNSGNISLFFVRDDGNIGIGTDTPTEKLDIIGTIRACEARVNMTGCDFVFEPDYDLMTLKKRREKVPKDMHLPHIKPAKEMEKDGAALGEISSGILQNVEEHELYLYSHDERIEKLEVQNKLLFEKIEDLITENEELKKGLKAMKTTKMK